MAPELAAAILFLVQECDETLATFSDETSHPSYQMSVRKKRLLSNAHDETVLRDLATLFLLDVWAMCKDVIGDNWTGSDQHTADLKALFWKVDGLLRSIGFDTAHP